VSGYLGKCRKPEQQLIPWSQSRLVGAEGSQLHMFGSADMSLNLKGEKFDLSVVGLLQKAALWPMALWT